MFKIVTKFYLVFFSKAVYLNLLFHHFQPNCELYTKLQFLHIKVDTVTPLHVTPLNRDKLIYFINKDIAYIFNTLILKGKQESI